MDEIDAGALQIVRELESVTRSIDDLTEIVGAMAQAQNDNTAELRKLQIEVAAIRAHQRALGTRTAQLEDQLTPTPKPADDQYDGWGEEDFR